MTMQETANLLVREAFQREVTITSLTKLHGDASYRTYYRALLDDGTTIIIMQMPQGASSVSEEITNFNGTHQELPFLNVARYLKSLEIPTPEVHLYDHDAHLMILEDIGEVLLFDKVKDADRELRATWYERAIDLLVSLQERSREGGPAQCIAFARSFDASLLNWEFDHFREYGIEARLGMTLPPEDRRIFEEETRAISAAIEQLPYGFTHRDFQSRNIMLKKQTLYLIDFQDALLGPYVYDLVALTRDSYVELDAPLVARLLQSYAMRRGERLDDIQRAYDLVTVQRKLKDAGRFVFIDRIKKNASFLSSIPASLRYVRAALERMPERAWLLKVLSKYIPEWR